RPLAVDDARQDPRTRELGVAALLAAPIFLAGKLAGVLAFENPGGAPRAWSAGDVELAASLADGVALALAAEQRAGAERQLERAYRDLGQVALQMEAAREDERRRLAR